MRRVEVAARVARPAAECWAILSDFGGLWHPAVEWIEADPAGALRRFGVKGEGTVYVERLIWRSDSAQRMMYRHEAGIRGVRHYQAEIEVVADAGGAEVSWRAEIEADEPRLSEIASGTEAVFRMGLDALGSATLPPAPNAVPLDERKTVERVLDSAPRLSVLQAGEGGTLCLFLHGIGGGKENWRGQLATLPEGVAGAALDLRGYGGSALGPEPSRLEDYFADILAVKAALGAERLILVGLSYGAWIATAFALAHPDTLAGLVLAGGCTGMSDASEAERAAFRNARQVPLDAGQTPADFAPAVVDVIAGPGADDATRAALQATMAAIPADTYRDALNCFTNPPGPFDLAELNLPVLMMTGAHDRLAPPDEIEGVSRRIANAAARAAVQFEVIAGAGHVCNLEQPEVFNAHLARFWRRIVREASAR